jgi:hypothetical protein
METHFHLVVRTPEPNLSRAMQWLNQSYAAWFNARQGRVGPVFQRPFGSVVVENGAWAYELSLYVHLNPLRVKALGLSSWDRKAARLGASPAPSRAELTERLKRLRQYRWSSYRAYAGYVPPPAWLETREVWRRAARREEDCQAAYRKDLQQRASVGGEPAKLEALRDGIAIGSAAFVRKVKQMATDLGIAAPPTLRTHSPVLRTGRPAFNLAFRHPACFHFA